jgi:hypothetical protein
MSSYERGHGYRLSLMLGRFNSGEGRQDKQTCARDKSYQSDSLHKIPKVTVVLRTLLTVPVRGDLMVWL